MKADEIRNTMEFYSSIPHIAGSWEDHDQALYTKQKYFSTSHVITKRFESFGLTATIQEIPVLLSYPVLREVGIVYPPGKKKLKIVISSFEDKVFNCTLKEAVVNDTTSGNPDAAPTWNGYTPTGEAVGELGRFSS